MRSSDAMDSEHKAQLLLAAVEDRKAVEPTLLDLRGKTLLFDFCLVCSGTSNVHIRAIADAVLEKSEDARLNKPRATGEESAEWVLLDFGDVVVHILDEDSRARYQLEKFWSTPQPKGALPPTPDSVRAAALARNEADDVDAPDLDEEDRQDAEYFDTADQEVEPIDEDDLDDLNDQDLEELDDEDLDDLDEEDDLREQDDEDEDDQDDAIRQPR